MIVYKVLIDFVGVVFELVVIRYMFQYLLKGSKLERRMEWLMYLVCAALMTLAVSMQNSQIINPLVNLAVAFLLSLGYNGKFGMKVFLSALVLILLTFTEMITGAFLMLITKMDIAEVQRNMLFYMLGVLASKLLVFLLVKIIGYRRLDIYRRMPVSVFVGLLLTPISSFVAMYIMGAINYNNYNNGILAAMLGVSALMLIANFFVFYLFENQLRTEHTKLKLAFAEKQVENQAEYYKELSDHQLEIRKLSHDMKNSLTGLMGMLQDGQSAEALRYLENVCGNIANDKIPYDTGHAPVDALLMTKHQSMLSKGIAFEPQIILPERIKMDVLDLCIVLGCALDNAMEACEKIDGERRVELHIGTTEKYLSIRIENTANEPGDKGGKTKKADGYYHGFGLESIRGIAAKYDGNVEKKFSDGIFRLFVMVKYG